MNDNQGKYQNKNSMNHPTPSDVKKDSPKKRRENSHIVEVNKNSFQGVIGGGSIINNTE